MTVGGSHGGLSGGGTITDAFGTKWVAGTGIAYVNGSPIAPESAAGHLYILRSGHLVLAGLPQPTVLPIINDAGVAGKNNGTYSVAITAVDQVTGQESVRSLPSVPALITNHKANITFPATVQSNQTHWGLYCSFANFGATGPWFFLQDVTVTNVGGFSQAFDWANGELSALQAPIDYFPPPPCTHCFAVNNVMNAAGVGTDGSGIAPSVPGVPGAFDPSFITYIPGGGPITACKATGFAGSVLVSTATSLNGVIATPSPISPIAIRQIWPLTGFPNGNCWTTIEDEVYGVSGQLGFVRTQGDSPPDTTFANPIFKYARDNNFLASNTVVTYDPHTDSVLFCSGTKALAFGRSRGWWHLPMTLPGTGAQAATTLNGHAYVDCGSGNLFGPELGSGVDWSVTFSFDSGENPEYNKTLIGARVATSIACKLKVFTNLNTTTARPLDLAGNTFKTVQPNHGAWIPLNVRKAATFTFNLSGLGSAGPKQSVYEVVSLSIPHPVRTRDTES